ncbi:rhodanese-like domain-containing protein [Hymenobacter chitinivorans]|uniref:Rhodanese-related sulfurtransferase n=1 Tax=Hymenobacter chitinivorans DSM 11115 TaxID=1121954 RepID=A0A2M9BQ62_9BACT|nr:rhodanese-like domain-containing protein [Hymenobacter chitinivorans]PJJ60057.1 rhodanese-related sulfurtransferase [Hymenobacter chitinivorans DSM 11115]
MKRPAFLAWGLLLSACGSKAQTGDNPGYDRLLRTLYKNTVPVVRPAALAQELQQNPAAVVVLDTRTPAEYRVSHLPGARFVDFDTYEKATFADLPRDRKVVVYCSVGYRSERVGERLRALGFTQVQNLYGGIFQWVNEGRPVYNQQGLTQNVHPYSALWSLWLSKGNKVYE